MAEDNPFRVPLSDLTAVHVEQGEQVEVSAEPQVAQPWVGPLAATADGGGGD